MSLKFVPIAALALMASLAGSGAASAASCRDASGHFTKCPAVAAPAAGQKCRDASGKFAKCTAAGAKPVAAVSAKTAKK
jgi:hypothetical protein